MGQIRANLGALRTFEAVARHSSVTRAAGELHVTPGAVSQQVRQLESALKVELFVRKNQKLFLTDGGRLLADRLAICFDHIDRAVDDVAGDATSRKVRLRVSPTFAVRWLVPRLPAFYNRHPDLEIEVGTYSRSEDVSLHTVEFMVRRGNGMWDDGESEPMFYSRLIPVCSPEIAGSLRKPADLLKQNLIHSMLRGDAWERWFAAAGMPETWPTRNTKLANGAVGYQAAADGLGVALAEHAYVEDDLKSGKLVAPFDQEFAQEGEGYYLVYPKRKAHQINVRTFRCWIRSQCADGINPKPACREPPVLRFDR